MTWPSSDVNTTGMDAGTDTPPRAEILSWAQKFNQLRAHVTTFMQGLLGSADAAAARATLDVPSRAGGNATGTWGISISGNAATATTAANASALGGVGPSGYQAALGFTPLQQGGGPSQGSNTLKIGWGSSGEGLRLTVDSTDFGTTWPISVESSKLSTSLAALGSGAVGTYGLFAVFSSTTVAPGATIAGSDLRYASGTGLISGVSPSGTWRCCGAAFGGSSYGDRTTVFVRIA